MPSVKQFFDELKKLGVDPDDVRLPADIYDKIVDDAEEPDESDDEQNPDEDED